MKISNRQWNDFVFMWGFMLLISCMIIATAMLIKACILLSQNYMKEAVIWCLSAVVFRFVILTRLESYIIKLFINDNNI